MKCAQCPHHDAEHGTGRADGPCRKCACTWWLGRANCETCNQRLAEKRVERADGYVYQVCGTCAAMIHGLARQNRREKYCRKIKPSKQARLIQ
jgi:hypothetical protein